MHPWLHWKLTAVWRRLEHVSRSGRWEVQRRWWFVNYQTIIIKSVLKLQGSIYICDMRYTFINIHITYDLDITCTYHLCWLTSNASFFGAFCQCPFVLSQGFPAWHTDLATFGWDVGTTPSGHTRWKGKALNKLTKNKNNKKTQSKLTFNFFLSQTTKLSCRLSP